MIFYNHPYTHIVELLKSLPESNIEFSIYKYKPQTIFDCRKKLSIHPSDFSEEWLSKKISSLNINEELAFHSKLIRSGRNVHVPMIDLDCPIQELDLAKSALHKVLPPYIFSGLRFYNSGRSLHAYGSCILTRTKWIEFMGCILLANLPKTSPIVDTRWVGHRLLGGFSSLRWSSNSSYYLKVPELV